MGEGESVMVLAKRRRSPIVLVATAAAFMLAACGGGGDGERANGTSDTSSGGTPAQRGTLAAVPMQVELNARRLKVGSAGVLGKKLPLGDDANAMLVCGNGYVLDRKSPVPGAQTAYCTASMITTR